MRLSFLCLLLIGQLSCGTSPDTAVVTIPLEDVDLSTLNINKSNASIYISKSNYEISLLENGKILKTWKMVLGFNPTDDKWRQGDGCTPEGNFRVRDLYPHSAWSKFIWIEYPNEESRKKHAWAKSEGLIPEDAKIGGEVGIHGTPIGAEDWIDQNLNWTLGCVSLTNDAVDELYKYIQKGTPIQIE